jgi:DNA helicase IV
MSDPDTLTPTDQALIDDERVRYSRCYASILEALSIKTDELDDNQKLARELTSRLVAEQREEEKQFLLSDETVAHGLVKLRLEEKKGMQALREQPYFARVIYQEKGREIEFKLGLASYPKERIIDWRKAPISKLYYDYEEGEPYDDEIAGVERKGEIRLKRAYRGKNGKLTAIELKDSSFVFSREAWHKQKRFQNATFSINDRETIRKLLASGDMNAFSRIEGDDGYLPQILSLLTPEQFSLISSDTNKPVIIQGSAGTGKTTVALHRLAWMLFEGNSKAREETTLVVMFNRVLANYVKNILPDLGIKNVTITTYFDWAQDIFATALGSLISFNQDVPNDVARFKADHKTLGALEAWLEKREAPKDPRAGLLEFWTTDIIQNQLKNSQQGRTASYLANQKNAGKFDLYDAAFLLRLIRARDGLYRTRQHPSTVEHLVIDEAQDFTVVELKTLVEALEDKNQLTLAGDLGQKILENRDFGTWRELLTELGLGGVDVLNLNVAYRSTFQIYEIAEHIRDPNAANEDLRMTGKFGAEPKLTLTSTFTDAVAQTQAWIETVAGINRHTIAAIVCRTAREARDVHQALLKRGAHGVRLGDAQHFDFTPGITVTDVHQIKGLEFRNLLVFNPSLSAYSAANPHDRNLLYVAVTRAEERLDFICYEAPSVLLPDFLNLDDMTLEVEDDDAPERPSHRERPELFDNADTEDE